MALIPLLLLISLPVALVAIFGKATVSLGGHAGRTTGRICTALPDGTVIEARVNRNALPVVGSGGTRRPRGRHARRARRKLGRGQ